MLQRRNLSPWLTVLLAIPIVLLALWVIPQYQVAPLQERMKAVTNPEKLADLEKERIVTENSIRTGMIQGIGGVLVAITAFVGYKNYQAALEKNTAERFSKAVEQLGNDNIHVRLGGIYALEQIAKDAEEKYYWHVMETLTAYVRVRAKRQEETELEANPIVDPIKNALDNCPEMYNTGIPKRYRPSNSSPEKLDIQAVLTVLGRRKHSYLKGEQNRLNLQETDLRHLLFRGTKGAFRGIWLVNADLQGADLSGIDIQDAVFNKSKLQGAILIEAKCQKANLCSTDLRLACLSEANFSNALLKGAYMQQVGANEAMFENADLSDADFTHAHLDKSKLHGAKLFFANLSGASLEQAEGLTWEQLQEAASYEGAKLPDYLLQNLPEKTKAQSVEKSQQGHSSDDGKAGLG